jgi:hypothetical protein
MPKKSLSLYSTNIHSLPCHYHELEAHLKLFNHPPDIIALPDNYLDKTVNPNSYDLKAMGYDHQHNTDISIYYNTNLFTTLLDHPPNPLIATNIIQIHNTKQCTNPIHTIIAIYLRPDRKSIAAIDSLQTTIDNILTEHPQTTITIIGDLNYNLLRLTPLLHLHKFLLHNNLHTTITTPTRYDDTHNTATSIDVILTTRTATNVTAGTISPAFTDHLPIYAIFHQPPHRQQQKAPKTLSIRRYEKNKDIITADIRTAVTETINQSTPTTTTSQHFHNIQLAIQQIIETHERTPKPRRKPWCTPQIKRQIRKQHKLHKRRVTHPTPENIQRHAHSRTRVKAIIRQAKREHIQDQIESSQNNPKEQARVLKSVIPGRAQSRTSPTLLVYEGIEYTDPTDIANALNDRYITIGHKTNQTIPQHEEEHIAPEREDHKPPPFELQHVTTTGVTKTMDNINRNKASDIFKIKPAIIKDITPYLAPILSHLFNRAIDEHEYPDALKVTKVIELYKSKEKTNPANYRPISLLPIIAKIFDTLINNQMMLHLTTNNIISPTQYAFRPNSSTTLALQTILNKIHKHKSQRNPLLAIYVDLSKAYDTISHERLLHKLRHDYNFTEHTTTFFASYFQNRQQSTHTQHAQSRFQTITHGVPQGSTLSTTFFLLYINEIVQAVPKSKVYTYADDTTLIITAATLQDLETLAQSELSGLISYFHNNNLVPNPTKTVYSIFYPHNAQPIQLTIGDKTLQQEKQAKLLGHVVQDDLKHQQAINAIIKKLQPHMHSFKFANKLLPLTIMTQLYYTHIYPHLILNISIWGSSDHSKTYLQPLLKAQKRIIRLIRKAPPRTHTKPIMAQLNILNVINLYTLRVCAEMHPFIYPSKKPLNRPEHNHNYTPVSAVHNHRTRYAATNHQRITDTMEHFTRAHANTWNSLPAKLSNISNRKAFTTQLKLHLLHKQNEP